MMFRRIRVLVLVSLVHVLVVAAWTNTEDVVALKALKDSWKNVPGNWAGSDPCGSSWVGIKCNDDHRVVSITLASINLIGQLSSDIKGLSELQTLDLSYNKGMTGPIPPTIEYLKKLSSLILVGCGFSGPIPPSIGSLTQLIYLSLNANNFAGLIPSTIGNLSNLYWLDLSDNKLTGAIPMSKGGTLGLDMLVNTKHFHLGKNQLSGEIPPQLFSSSMTLIHLLLDNNEITGSIPWTLGLVRSLEVVRLDRNSFTGPAPKNLNNLSSVQELFLGHNELSGPMPDLTGMEFLSYLDMSNNTFDPSGVPTWFSSLQSVTSLIMDNTNIQGQLPVSLFSLPQLQTVKLKNNRINGTLNLGPSFSNQLQLIDLENNFVDSVTQRPGRTVHTILVGNPVCDEGALENFCKNAQLPNASYSTPPENCTPLPCNSDQVSSPSCKCAYPYTGDLIFRAPSFSNYGNATLFASLNKKLMDTFNSSGQPVDSVSLSNPTKNVDDYLVLNLQVFPSGQNYFNQTGISSVGFILSKQTFRPPTEFGPLFFRANNYPYNAGLTAGSNKTMSRKVVIGAVVGVSAVLLLLVAAAAYAFRQKKRAETAVKKNNPFATWDSKSNSGGVPQLKGARCFSFEEVKRYTDNFSEMNDIGAGGYGKVYRGRLPDGRLVAIKRAQQGSSQGSLEFKTEIELLSRVHHRNLVALVGFCFDHGEQMLVYEYISNGTLKEALNGKTGFRLDWMRRLRIALGAAKGLQYLHDLASPRIIHRDVKSNNILLDERLNAKVADFGLCKLLTESDVDHVTTQVKGTMGYMDPEYYMTQQLTEKSDVYSFGVVLLEILMARGAIVRGKYIVREVKLALDKEKEMYGLQAILDPIVVSTMAPRSAERLVDLALRCVEESGVNRPHMSDVVKEIEHIMESSGLNPNAESSSGSESYEKIKKGSGHPYSNENLFNYSGYYSPSDVEPK